MVNHQKTLMYHSIGSFGNEEAGAELYSVSVEDFRKQMEYIKAMGTVPCGDNPHCDPCITFDDGLLNNYTNAYPILKEFGLKAYFFILAGKVGVPGHMSWKQIKELMDAGMIIGSHGTTHRILVGLNDAGLDCELSESKTLLEEKLGQPIDYFSVPRGFHNRKIIAKAKSAGYKAVFTSNPKDNDGFQIGRIPIKGDWGIDYFIAAINNGLSFKDKMGELLKNSSRMILGVKNYDKLRTKILKK